MVTLTIYPTSINARFVSQCVDALRDGKLIIYPTDTLYAIGCDATNQAAVERLCKFKNINPNKNTLSIVCADISQASGYARIDNRAFSFVKKYTPGPFTFILPASTSLPKAFKGRRQVGVRIPDNDIARAIASELGRPIMSSSIPYEGLDEEEITSPEEIMLRYDRCGDIAVMVNGGVGYSESSTIIDLTDSTSPEIIREGRGVM